MLYLNKVIGYLLVRT